MRITSELRRAHFKLARMSIKSIKEVQLPSAQVQSCKRITILLAIAIDGAKLNIFIRYSKDNISRTIVPPGHKMRQMYFIMEGGFGLYNKV